MLTRIISAVVGLILFFAVMFSEKTVLTIAIIILSTIALYEALNAYGYLKHKILIVLGFLSSVAFSLGDKYHVSLVFAFFLLFLIISVAILLKKHEEFSTKDIFTIMFLNLLIPFVFGTFAYIRRMENGIYYVWLPFIAAWMTDTFAYFTGRFFGKHKLAEKISPKKTIEGSIGGIIGAVVGFLVFSLIINNVTTVKFNIPIMILVAVISSVLSQMGDLFASCAKRENNIKDFGNIMPGHGGVLDRFDSLILTAPFIFILLRFIPFII